MGTSSAFGGSGAWSDTVDSLYDAADGINSGGTELPAAVMSALGKALGRGDRRGKSYNVRDLLPSRSGSGATGLAGREPSGVAELASRTSSDSAARFRKYSSGTRGTMAHMLQAGLDAVARVPASSTRALRCWHRREEE